MKQRSILITGANGQLGRCLQQAATANAAIRLLPMGREHMPVDQFALTDKILRQLKPDVVINAAAYTQVDKSEAEPERANYVNGYAVGHLAECCRKTGSRFIHVSSDYVFDGRQQRPYREDDATNPISVYGRSKLLGEKLASEANPDSVIVRSSWVYSAYGHNFVKTMLRLFEEKDEIGVVNDQQGSPTYAKDLAEVLLQLALREATPAGIFHCANAGSITWFGFAVAIRDLSGAGCRIRPITTSEYPVAAARPAYSVLDTQKLASLLQQPIPGWQSSLRRCLQELDRLKES